MRRQKTVLPMGDNMIQVIEEFVSVNGEGMKSGELAYFIRLNGCNLRCSWCDTAWSQVGAPYQEVSLKDLTARVVSSGVRNVTITGGEPLEHASLETLIEALIMAGPFRIEVETNGSRAIEPYKKKFDATGQVSFTVDYKLPSSGMSDFMVLENYKALGPQDTLKLVIEDDVDLEVGLALIKTYDLLDATQIILSPCYGKIEPVTLVEALIAEKMNGVRIQMQLHKWIWDPEQRGV